jgi:hypothetical protein
MRQEIVFGLAKFLMGFGEFGIDSIGETIRLRKTALPINIFIYRFCSSLFWAVRTIPIQAIESGAGGFSLFLKRFSDGNR